MAGGAGARQGLHLGRMLGCFPGGQLKPAAVIGISWRGLMGSTAPLAGPSRRMPSVSAGGAPDSRPDAPFCRHERNGRDFDRGAADFQEACDSYFWLLKVN